ncbi:MAG: hypothetical protein GXO96_06755 [Nitrospirae bacterium]|nr:hypothetical protein [Candidatus Manganitrophaceae bacterium]
MTGSLLGKCGACIVFLYVAFSPLSVFAQRVSPTDPWISLEKNLLQIHKTYRPKSPLLKHTSLPETVQLYLDGGLWSSAEALLLKVPLPLSPKIEGLWLSFFLKRGHYDRIYATYRKNQNLFLGKPDLILGASQGALAEKDYREALQILDHLHLLDSARPEHHYFSALAYWGLQDNEKLKAVLAEALHWADNASDSPWVSRIHLLKVYYHLNQKEYDLAFASMGDLFDNNNTDLALLALTWGYFKLGATSNLFSVLQALDASQEQSPYHSQIYRILSRFLIEEGNLRGAIEMDQQERNELKKQMEVLEKESELLRRGISSTSLAIPPGSLLTQTLKQLEKQVGEKREMTALYWYIDLQQRRQMLIQLKTRERMIDQEQRQLQMEMVRRCLSLKRHERREHKAGQTFQTLNENPTQMLSESMFRMMKTQYQAARQAVAAEKQKEARGHLQWVAAFTPHQAYGEESIFRLGDMAFNKRSYAQAIAHYQELIDKPESPLHTLALYKTTWAYYLLGQPEAAIGALLQQEAHFAKTLQDQGSGPCTMVRTPQERREPFRLLALSLDQLGGPKALAKLTENISPVQRFAFYEKVTDHYQQEDKIDGLFQLIRSWIATYPLEIKTPFLHQKMVLLVKQSKTVSIADVVTARTEFVNKYRPESLWGQKNFAATTDTLKPILKQHLRFLMTHYYAEAKKTETQDAHKSVLTWYLYYLSVFPEEEDIGKDRFLYAEVLANLDEYQQAIVAFRKSAYQDPGHALAGEAAYQEILLLEKMHTAEGPEVEAAFERFATRFPQDDRAKEIAMHLAEIAFEQGDYNKSRFYAQKVAPKKNQTITITQELDLASYRLVVQAFIKEASYIEAISFINTLFDDNKTNPGNETQLRKTFNPLLVLAYFQQGESLKHLDADDEAAEAYWQAFRFGAGSEMGPLALFEAAVLWDRHTTLHRAETALALFPLLYPKSALNHPSTMRLAALYEKTERPLKGAETYEKAAQSSINPELAQKALEHALMLYETAESWEKLSALAMAQADTINSGYSKQNQDKWAAWMLKAAEANFEMRKSVTATRILETLIATTKGQTEIAEPVAKAHFILAEARLDDFEDIELVAPLEENLEKKRILFEALLDNYDHAVAHPSPLLALNANYRIGTLFEGFSRALLESERPEDLSLEEEELYENLLIEQALPYFEKAEEAYLQNIEIGESSGIQNEWIAKSQMHLFMIQQQIDIYNRGGQEVLG